MTILPRKGLLAIAVVVDVALQTDDRPISAKTLAKRHGLPPRHLELVLQSLVRGGILLKPPFCGFARFEAYQKLLILNQFFFGCRGIGQGQTRRVSIRLERSSKRRGTVLFGGLTLR